MTTKPVSQNVSVSNEQGTNRLAINDDGSINVNTGGGTTADVNVAEVAGVAVVAATAPVPVGFYNPSGGALLDPTLPTQVVGSVAAGATDSGNPVKAGALTLTSTPSIADGQRSNLYTSTSGELIANPRVATLTNADGVANATSTLAGIGSNGAPNGSVGLRVFPTIFNGTTWDRLRSTGVSGGALLTELGPYVPSRLTADGQVKGSAGFIHTVSFSPTGSVTAGTITIYNNTAESGTQVFSFAAPATTFTPFSVALDVACSTGIYVGYDGTVANVQVTVSYR